MKYIQFLSLLTFVILFSSCKQDSKQSHHRLQPAIDSLDASLTKISEETSIPGFTALIVQGNELIYSTGFGYSDIANKHKFTAQTIHNIASISKTFVGVALMKLVENGKLNLDDPINNFLPFEIESPHFPESVITIRHLVTHTSSLNDNFDDGEKRPSQLVEQSRYNKEEMPEELAEDIYYWDGMYMALEEYIEQIFTPSGKWYDESNFSKFKPGETYEYSNEGTNLAALIVELVSGIPFSEFTQKYIFEPLKMTNTSWIYTDLDSTISKLYVQYEEEYPSQVFEFPRSIDSGQPCGDLKSNGDDLRLYLVEMMNGFKGKGKILNATSYQTLLTPQLSQDIVKNKDANALNDEYDVGVFWAISKPGYRLHKGGSTGVFSILYFNPTTNIGVISYCNLAHPDFGKIVNTISAFEKRIGKISSAATK